ARIERPPWFCEQPPAPVGILFTDLAHLGPAAPAWAVVIPDDLDLADPPDGAIRHQVPDRPLIRFAAMLGADLYDQVAREDGVARRLGVGQAGRHRLLAISVLARFSRHPQ